MSQYPEDEFDLAAKNRGPKGVHRPAESRFRRILPFLIVIVAAPLVAWGVMTLITNNDDTAPTANETTQSPQETEEPTEDPTGDEGADPEEEPTEPPSDEDAVETDEPQEPEETEEPEAEVDFAAGVSVLNGSGITGLAGRAAEQLTGFTDVFVGNYQSPQPTVSTVFYQTEELRATAEHIADILGIANVTDLASASNEIVVTLRSDFAP